MSHIFVSYRRQDAPYIVGRIVDALKLRFGKKALFLDVYGIEAGSDFRVKLEAALTDCKAFLAIIGDDWLEVSNEAGQRRIDDPQDWVHVEIATALGRQIPLIPVLVENQTMPCEEDLPEPLRDLASRQAVLVRGDPDFQTDMEQLCEWLSKYIPQVPRRQRLLRRALILVAFFTLILFGALTVRGVYQHKLFASRADELEGKLLGEIDITELHEVLSTAPQDVAEEVVNRSKRAVEARQRASDTNVEELMELARQRSRRTLLVSLHDSRNVNILLATAEANQSSLDLQTRAYLIRDLAASQLELDVLSDCLNSTSLRPAAEQALILAIGSYPEKALTEQPELYETMLEIFKTRNDPGVHAAAWWTLREGWGQDRADEVQQAIDELAESGVTRLSGLDSSQRHWFVHPRSKITFVYFPEVNEFRMGDSSFERHQQLGVVEAGMQLSPKPRLVAIPRKFLISMTEITERQMDELEVQPRYDKPRGPNFAQAHVTWFESTQFCNALTADEQRHCYRKVAQSTGNRMEPVEKHLEMDGYRLPTEAEWEYACRGGAGTPFCFGVDAKMLRYYASIEGSRDVVASKLPNRFGLFDCHGGLAEWCYDNPAPYPATTQAEPDWGTTNDDSKLESIIRGGDYRYDLGKSRGLASFERDKNQRRYHKDYIGFRVARTVKEFPPSD